MRKFETDLLEKTDERVINAAHRGRAHHFGGIAVTIDPFSFHKISARHATSRLKHVAVRVQRVIMPRIFILLCSNSPKESESLIIVQKIGR